MTRPGLFGNPFETAKSFAAWLDSGEIALTDLRPSWLPWCDESKERLRQKRDAILKKIPGLHGKQLACFCGLDAACHADYLAARANRLVVLITFSREMYADTKDQLLEICSPVIAEECSQMGVRFVGVHKLESGFLSSIDGYSIRATCDTVPLELPLQSS